MSLEMKNILNLIITDKDLDENTAEQAMELIMSGDATLAQIGAFLVAMRKKGENFKEIAAFARVMRKFCNKITPNIPKNAFLIDTCGTGGDVLNTFNISTSAAFILASADLYVAKHGNRSVSSSCGSADLLEGLGVNINASPEIVKKCIEEAGIGFMFAPIFHPAMKHAIGPRKEIGIRTVFNILGPLTNPASAQGQILGVFSSDLTEKMARTLQVLGVQSALTFHGIAGIDEISNLGKTVFTEIKNNEITNFELDVTDFGIKKAELHDIAGGSVQENIKTALNILNGEKSAKRDIVLMNSAAGLYIANKVQDFKEGIRMSEEIIEKRTPISKLKRLIEISGGDLEKFKVLEEKY
ncbi:MAG: anthranilate phosphoribosyltransferase [Candidatus Helarchaeota archaeon]